MATLDSFREATGEPIQLDLANGYIRRPYTPQRRRT